MQDIEAKLYPYARQLRRQQTDAERQLWRVLRDRQLQGFKFRRQHPIGCYIVDFCCLERKLVVELDGGHHLLQSEADQCRTDFLVNRGYQVLRFWDHEVLIESETVLEQVLRTLQSPSPQPSP